MAATVFSMYCLLNGFVISNAIWLSPQSTLIRSDNEFAVGAYNESVFLLGGDLNPRQITQYRIDIDTFIDLGEDVLTNDITGVGQFYSQKDDKLYMIDKSGSTLSVFHLNDEQYIANWKSIAVDVSYYGCLATSGHHLYVVGGKNNNDYLNTLQILEFSTLEWLQNDLTMNERRGYHSCIVHYEYLWAFAGHNFDNNAADGYLNSNERIGITDITSNEWSYIEPLSQWIVGLRAIASRQSIFIIGGTGVASYYESLDIVHIVDCTTGSVTVSPDKLVYKVAYAGVILVHNIIYAFGGHSLSEPWTNKWMQYQLETTKMSTTVEPTHPFTSFAYASQSSTIGYIPSISILNSMTTTDEHNNITKSNESYVYTMDTSSPKPTAIPSNDEVYSTNSTPIFDATELEEYYGDEDIVITVTQKPENKRKEIFHITNTAIGLTFAVCGCCVCIMSLCLLSRCRKREHAKSISQQYLENDIEMQDTIAQGKRYKKRYIKRGNVIVENHDRFGNNTTETAQQEMAENKRFESFDSGFRTIEGPAGGNPNIGELNETAKGSNIAEDEFIVHGDDAVSTKGQTIS